MPIFKSVALTLDYPLRPDFLAQVVIPRDLTTEEARRLVAFLLALAVINSCSKSSNNC